MSGLAQKPLQDLVNQDLQLNSETFRLYSPRLNGTFWISSTRCTVILASASARDSDGRAASRAKNKNTGFFNAEAITPRNQPVSKVDAKSKKLPDAS